MVSSLGMPDTELKSGRPGFSTLLDEHSGSEENVLATCGSHLKIVRPSSLLEKKNSKAPSRRTFI